MQPFTIFLCAVVAFVAAVTAPLWADHAIVWMLRTFHAFWFPDAIRLAVSLERDTQEWTFRKYEAEHPTIGTIWIANEAYGIRVKVDEYTEWRPNWIERRIIRQAVDQAVSRRIHEHLHKTLPA